MTEAEVQITLAYVKGFERRQAMRAGWSGEAHLSGLKEVFRAGADAGRRQALSESSGSGVGGQQQ